MRAQRRVPGSLFAAKRCLASAREERRQNLVRYCASGNASLNLILPSRSPRVPPLTLFGPEDPPTTASGNPNNDQGRHVRSTPVPRALDAPPNLICALSGGAWLSFRREKVPGIRSGRAPTEPRSGLRFGKRVSELDSPIALPESAPLDIVRPGGSTNDRVGESEQ